MINNTYPHEIKMIVSDIDHTFSNSYNEYDSSVIISDLNKKMVKWVQDQGILFTYATGRHVYQYTEFTDLPSPSTYVLCNNGGVIYDPANGSIIKNTVLSKEELIKILNFTKQHKKQIYLTTPSGFFYYNGHGLHKDPSPLFEIGEHCDVPWQMLENTQINSVEFIGEHHELQTLQNNLETADIVADTSYAVFTSQRSMGIYSRQAQKGVGLEFLSKYHNIPLENFMVFGDAMNDYSMFIRAGIKVAMTYAMPELKNLPNAYVTSNCDNAGVGEFLRAWFKKSEII